MRTLTQSAAPFVVTAFERRRAARASRVEDDAERSSLIDLVRRAQQGDPVAQRKLVIDYQARISGFVFTLINQDSCVEDLSQQTFIKMLRAIPRLQHVEQFESWLFRIARNVCMDYLRQQKLRQIFLPFLEEHERVPQPDGAVGSEELDALRYALGMLRPSDRALLALVQEGNSYAEISRVLEINVPAVKARVHRARESLREHYQPDRHDG